MHIRFIHQAFPAQFGRTALELTQRHGWQCTFLIGHLSTCPEPSAAMLQHLQVRRLPLTAAYRAHTVVPWSQSYGRFLELAQAVFEAVRTHPELRPDLVVSHDSLGPTLFLPEVLACPLVHHCEYYFAPSGRDLTYRLDLPPTEATPFYPRCINAGALVSLTTCSGAYTPTHWQRQSYPPRFRDKLEVHFDGIDTDLYRPRTVPRVVAGRAVPPGTRLVTFVARGLESMRGFDRFLQVAGRIARARSDVLFVVVGQEESFYSWDRLHTGQVNFKDWALRQGDYDLSRFVFLRYLAPEPLAALFCLSDLHLYLTVPFVLSWSLFNALASGCVVLAGDVAPVREVIEPGRNGLLEPLFDTEALAATALRVLADPAAYRPLGQAGRALMLEKYSVDVAVPELKAYFERLAGVSP